MDPVQFYRGDDKNDKLMHLISDVNLGGPPVEIYEDGVKVAVVITPEEYDLLNRLVKGEK
jgi:PHD/YefM family antitoxin component YafN of YafNO toxin-antitoxin module